MLNNSNQKMSNSSLHGAEPFYKCYYFSLDKGFPFILWKSEVFTAFERARHVVILKQNKSSPSSLILCL